jgi:uncharacterized protein YkwD
MNTVDITLIFIIALSAFIGYYKGFIHFCAVIVKWCGSTAAPFFITPIIVTLLAPQLRVQTNWLYSISFILLFLICFALFSFLEKRITRYTKREIHIHWFNKTSGIAAGVAGGVLLSAICIHITGAVNNKSVNQELSASVAAAYYKNNVGNNAEAYINNTTAAMDALQVAGAASSNTNNTESFQTYTFNSDAEKELQLLQLVNEERMLHQLAPLQINSELSTAAKLHGADMFTRGYFSHNTPEGKDPFHRLNDLHIPYKYAGENLAYSFSIIKAHAALMQSPGHRANILNPKFSKIGISVLNGGEKGLIVVQEFKH